MRRRGTSEERGDARDKRDQEMHDHTAGRDPLALKVRYWIVMLAFLAAAAGATVAIRNTAKVDTTAHRVSVLARQNAALVKRVADDEHATCVIQARGLPAGHQLAATMKYIYVLLTLPPAPGAAQTPPKIEKLILALDSHLAAYLKAEAKQPPTRSCVTR